MGGDRVLDRQAVKSEFLRDGGHFAGGGPVQPDPGHPAVLGKGLEGLLKALRLGAADAVHVDGVVDDGHGLIIAVTWAGQETGCCLGPAC